MFVIKPLFSIGIERIGKKDMRKKPTLQTLAGKESVLIHEIPIEVMKFHFTFLLRQAARNRNKFQSNFSFFPIIKKKLKSQNRWTKCCATKPSLGTVLNRITALNSHLKAAPDHFTKTRLYYRSSFDLIGFSKKPRNGTLTHLSFRPVVPSMESRSQSCVPMLSVQCLGRNRHSSKAYPKLQA